MWADFTMLDPDPGSVTVGTLIVFFSSSFKYGGHAATLLVFFLIFWGV